LLFWAKLALTDRVRAVARMAYENVRRDGFM